MFSHGYNRANNVLSFTLKFETSYKFKPFLVFVHLEKIKEFLSVYRNRSKH